MNADITGLKVLHLLKTGDGAHWAYRHMRELCRRGVEVHAAVPPGKLLPTYREAGIIVHEIDLNATLTKPGLLRTRMADLSDLVGRVQPDLVHSHFVGTTLTMRLALRRNRALPRVFQVPGPLHLEHWATARMEVATASAADYWIGTCNWTCARYRELGVAPQRVFLCYYGREPGDFVVGPKGALRTELGLDDSTRIVGMVAYMYPPKRYLGYRRGIKGHEDLIDALAICAQERDDIVGVFVGGAAIGGEDYGRSVRDYAQRALGERARFLGTRPPGDMPLLYPDFDVAVHPSLSENIGGAVESLLAHCPTIATNVGGFPDVVRNGDTGWLVPPGDPQRLAQAILEVLSRPLEAQRRTARGYARALEINDIRSNVSQLVSIYATILRQHHAA